jgi:hypothetical protein
MKENREGKRVTESETSHATEIRSQTMTSQQSASAERGNAAPAIEREFDPDSEPPDDLVTELTPSDPEEPPSEQEAHLDSRIVEELTSRLSTSELVKIIKGALACGRHNLPFTESDFLRAVTFGSSSLPVWQPPRARRG